jgi:ribosomal protein S18 acetylase RimI-like enzyme
MPESRRRYKIMRIRPIDAKDRHRVCEIIKAVGNFNEVEMDVAIELVDDSISEYSSGDYISCVLEDELGEVQAFGCYGLTPLTDATYDFYWMAVHPDAQGRGIGRKLIRFVEEDVRARGGNLLVLETSSQESYRRTTSFYQKSGYELTSRIRDFYRANDDKLIYVKYLKEK